MTIVLDKIQFLSTKKKGSRSTKYIITNPRKIKLAFKSGKKNNKALDCIPRFLISLEAQVFFKVLISQERTSGIY